MPGCGHAFYYHLDGVCWQEDNCVCNATGRRTKSPDGYLEADDEIAMMNRW